ncbi:MAG: cytochrome b/b6 domain-containing protein [Gammaproteobacteria bacterium]|nr:cytochrome b/b6 domain-containing protein [Gammaproteobacteria bacterium]
MAEQIRRVKVWGGWLRLAHWSIALSTLWLAASGWLVAHAPSVAASASELHYVGAGILLFGLGLRLFLGFFGAGAERFEHMLPTASELRGMRDSALFYLTLGKAPLPNWFAHNPLWKPVYLLLLLLLALQALVGWLMPDMPLLWRFYLPHVHQVLATLIVIVVVAHVYSVVLQDAKGAATDISAMINGYRHFNVDRDGLVKPDPAPVMVSLDSLRKPPSEGQR